MISKKTKIGFIGTGIMGLPMAKNLIKSKYDVYSYVRNKNNHSFIKKNRIKIIHSIDDFYSEIDILILVVSETSDVKQLLIGKDGLIAKKINHQ